MIRYLEPQERDRIRPLYEAVFEDTEAFMDYYFHVFIRQGTKCLVAEQDGEICSMVSVHEKEWCVRRPAGYVPVRAWYLYAVATASAVRRQGYMHRLLERICADAKEEQIPVIYLIPENPQVYAKEGFYLADAGVSESGADAGLSAGGSVIEGSWYPAMEDAYTGLARLYALYHERLGYTAYLHKQAQTFRQEAEMAGLEQGNLYLYYVKAHLCAYAMAVPRGTCCEITEYISFDNHTYGTLSACDRERFLALAGQLGCTAYRYRRLPVMLHGETGREQLRLGAMDEV